MAFGSVAIVAVIAVVALAYGTTAPSLAVAEFAPSARESIEPPPTTAGNQVASRGGQSARRPTSTTVPETAATSSTAPGGGGSSPTTRVARTRACVGNPPRQIEDPMSPPCMAAIFEGDNGGATHAGVSATEIRVAIPAMGASATSVSNRTIDAMFEFLNQRFEFYGRRLVPVYVSGSTGNALADRALGADVASRGIFAATTAYSEWIAGQVSLPVELARQGLVTIVRAGSTWWSDRTLYDQYHPFIWSVFPSSEDMQANLADLSCTVLDHRVASWAGDAELRGKPRRFGIVAAGWETPPSTSVLSNALANCTGSTPTRTEWATTRSTSAALDAGMARLEADGATTLVCVCEEWMQNNAAGAAHRMGFHPEWILTPSVLGTGNDEGGVQQMTTNASTQMAPPLRLSGGPKLLPIQARPWFGAVAPVLTAPGVSAGSVLSMAEFVYPELLVLASGIQGAGPQLTPETFAAALMGTQFPNPGAGQAPYWQPSAGFGPGDHSFYDDYQLGWWSTTAPALDVGESRLATGSWCYLDQGARFRVGAYPVDGADRLFNPNVPCR